MEWENIDEGLHVDTWGMFGTRKIDEEFDIRWIFISCLVGWKNILKESIILCLPSGWKRHITHFFIQRGKLLSIPFPSKGFLYHFSVPTSACKLQTSQWNSRVSKMKNHVCVGKSHAKTCLPKLRYSDLTCLKGGALGSIISLVSVIWHKKQRFPSLLFVLFNSTVNSTSTKVRFRCLQSQIKNHQTV